MIKVGFRISTERHLWLAECTKELARFSDKSYQVKDHEYYKMTPDKELFDNFEKEISSFYEDILVCPLLLITLIESTTQNMKAMLKGIFSEADIDKTMNLWLGKGIHSVTMDMNNHYLEAAICAEKRMSFLQKYGHRGAGELELANPRWVELGENAFVKILKGSSGPKLAGQLSVEEEINQLSSYKKQIIEKEWILLKEMLELRERWKMQLLSPYSHIRFIALEISRRYNIEDDIFWHSFQEILNKDFNSERAKRRKAKAEMSKAIYLPSILELDKLEEILSNKSANNSEVKNGISLSPGFVFGEVRVVLNPDKVNTDEWPANTILVAESTDPGWTGLFLKSKAIVVEKGGVLSHCAIVAREMNLPAISGIKQCHLRFKDGDKIWVDGNNGRITLA
jgi:phosphohistidine swiveling domain-containing protein